MRPTRLWLLSLILLTSTAYARARKPPPPLAKEAGHKELPDPGATAPDADTSIRDQADQERRLEGNATLQNPPPATLPQTGKPK